LEALRQRFELAEGFSPAQRVLIVDIVTQWRQEFLTQDFSILEPGMYNEHGQMIGQDGEPISLEEESRLFREGHYDPR
jgi:hypothetical protein